MSVALETSAQPAIPVEERLMDVGVIEDLTRVGRVVTVWEALSGKERKPISLVLVPPEGISFGDKAWYVPGGSIEFFYGREHKGTASMVELTPSQGKELIKRRDRILELIGRAGAPPYEFISDEAADELLEQAV